MAEGIFRKNILRMEVHPHPTILAIRDVCDRMDSVKSRFSLESDPDLIEGCIYELEALRSQYRFLLRIAREQGITCAERAYLWNE